MPLRAIPAAALMALLLLPPAASCAPPLPPPDPVAEREALLLAVDRLWDAYARMDPEGMGALLDEHAVQIGQRRTEGREAIVAFMRRWFRDLQIHGWTQSQRSVRQVGELALVSFWQEETGIADGEPYRAAGWVSDVWVRRPQGWLNLLTHVGADQAPPPAEE